MKTRPRRPKSLAIIKLGPYPRDVVLFDDRKKFDDYRAWSIGVPNDRSYPPSTKSRCNARTCYLQDGTVMAVGVFTGNRQSLVHELCHVIITAFDELGLQVTFSSSEAFTYLLDHMVGECSKYLWPTKGKRK